jgi:hypothetical protein
MKRILSILLLAFILSNVHCQTIKEYFFKENLPLNDSSGLILIIREPQTEFAKNLNHRIYRDTNFIKIVNESWFQEVKKDEEKVVHFCGFDMFFYKLEGNNMKFLNRMNSQCDINEINCKNFNILKEYGSPLHVDTLIEIPKSLFKKDLFNSNYLFSNHINSISWEICKTSKYPRIFYDYYFKTKISLDTSYTINENIENYIKTFTPNFMGINWNSWGENVIDFEKRIAIKKFIMFNEPCEYELDLDVYFTEDRLETFKDIEVIKIDFEIKNKEYPLVIFYSE